MDTATEEHIKLEKLIYKFEEDNKDLSLNEKLDLVREEVKNNSSSGSNFGWSDDNSIRLDIKKQRKNASKKITDNKYTFYQNGEDYILNLGSIVRGEDTTTELLFENVEDVDKLVINSTCGCTSADRNKIDNNLFHHLFDSLAPYLSSL